MDIGELFGQKGPIICRIRTLRPTYQRVAHLWLAGAVVSLIALALVGCASGGGLARPTPGPEAFATPTPGSKQVSSTPTSSGTGQDVLADAIRKLDDTQSYQFSVAAVLSQTVEGRPQEWVYNGSGAFAQPDKIQWTLEGQAEVFLSVVGAGGQVSCTDVRGPNTRDCSLAFGGPLPGSSPYTVISYLRNPERVGPLDQKSIQGVAYDHITFSPSLSKVSSLDPSHSEALGKVTSVQGEVWIDKKTGLPFRERVVVKSSSNIGPERVEANITFSKFNEQVNIQLSR